MNPQDLFNDIKAIKAQIEELKQHKPATADQVEAINQRPIQLDAKAFAQYVLADLKQGLPNTTALQEATRGAVQQITDVSEKGAKTIEQAASRIPRSVRVTGDVYGFTTFYAALAYGLVLLLVCFGAWLLCDHYREQAQETVIFKQAQEVIRERDYYYNQIQDYKRNNSKYARLFPAYDNKEFWD